MSNFDSDVESVDPVVDVPEAVEVAEGEPEPDGFGKSEG